MHNTIPAHTNDSARDAWQCSKGHVWSSSFTHISSSGTWCPECALDESRRTLEDYRTLAGKLGLAFIDKERPTSVSASCNWQCLVHPDKIISTSYHLLDNLSYHSPCNICQGDYSSTINFGVPSIEEAKSILKNIDTLREYDCKAVLFRLGGKTTLPREELRTSIKESLQKIVGSDESKENEQLEEKNDPLTMDECKDIFKGIHRLKAEERRKIAKRLGLSTNGDRDTLRDRIKAKLQQHFDETDEKVKDEHSNEIISESQCSDEKAEVIAVQDDKKSSGVLTKMELIKSSGEKWTISVREDGLLDLTNLAKAFGYRLDNYLASEKTKGFMKALSSLPEFQGVKLVETNRVGKTQHTFGHRLIAYNYAQYIDPEFAAQVCSWLDNLFLTGSVSLGKEKSSAELNSIWKTKYQDAMRLADNRRQLLLEKDEELKEKVRSHGKIVLKLKTRVEKLKMRRHHPELEEGFCIYCHHNGESAYSDRFKIGKGKDVNDVLRQARRNSPYTLLDFVMYLPEENYSLVEDAMKTRFLEERQPRSHEVYTSPLQELINGAESICDVLKIQYRFAEQSVIDSYNQFIIAETSAEDIGTQADDETVEHETEEDIQDSKDPEHLMSNTVNNIHNDQSNNTTNNITNNNISVNVNVDLSELKQLLKDIESFTCKKLDSLLIQYGLSKHGNKARKVEKLVDFIKTQIQDAQNLKNSCEKAKDT